MKLVGEVKKENTDEKKLASLMVGRDVNLVPKRLKSYVTDETVIELKNISYINDENIKVLDDISFSINKGEIFGIAGVSGNGQQDLCEVVSGQKKVTERKCLVKWRRHQRFRYI